MVIQNNIYALNSRRNCNKNSLQLSRSLEKLSSGYSVNRASDDAAGLAVSEKMRSQICGMKQSVRNCQDGISLIQTFEGALGETTAIIERMKNLADQSANGIYDNDVDRSAVEIEFLHLCDEVDQIAQTDFNGVVMLGRKSDGASATEYPAALASAGSGNVPLASAYSHTAKAAAAAAYAAVKKAAFAVPQAAGTVCGAFTVYGNSSDFSFDSAKGVLTILGGDITVEGTGAATTNTIVVAKDRSANVTLKDVNIDVGAKEDACAFKIEDDSTGNVNMILEGKNTLISGGGQAGLEKSCSNAQNNKNYGTLTISGNGSLHAESKVSDVNSGDEYTGAGIGGGYDCESCNIVIEGGDITAIGVQGAGIGGGANKGSKNIVFNGGNIHASSIYDAGIGGGMNGNGEDITINGGNVTAVGGKDGGAGIGGGITGIGKNITVNGGIVNASSRSNGAGIGGGFGFGGHNIVINGGQVTAVGGSVVGDTGADDICCGAGIGCGGNGTSTGSITINGGTVIAIGGSNQTNGAAGIGGSNCSSDSAIRISGKDTVVMAKGGKDSEDIGNGSESTKSSSVTIDSILTKEPYTGSGIVDGTIVHYTGRKPIAPDPDDPSSPNDPNTPQKLKVSTPNAFKNASAKLTYTDKLILQVNARSKDAVNFTFAYSAKGIGELAADLNCTAKGLGMDVLTLKTQKSANYAIDRLDCALNKVSMIRATFGAAQNRLEHKIDDLSNRTENLTAAESVIRDTDISKEMMNFTKNQIITQSSQSMLAQANSLPQQVISLISM